MKKVTLITTGQPTTNPRLVKEAETLIELGYQVTVIYCFYQQWAEYFDTEIISKNPEVYIRCGGSPLQGRLEYFKTRIRQKIAFYLLGTLPAGMAAENAISRTHEEALSLAKKLKSDLYIAHNLGALPAAVLAAKYNNAKVGYDAEDMHSGEFTERTGKLYFLNKHIEETYFPQANYFSTASPLIAAHYKKMYPYLNPTVVNNVFPKVSRAFISERPKTRPLKIFWFSQTIGTGRGLEQLIIATADLKQSVELHLLGNSSAGAEKLLQNLAAELSPGSKKMIFFHKPVSHNDLISMASQFDIGMAAETGVPLNRDICLTNKLFIYVQCGLALLASDTHAQKDFLQMHPATGKLYKRNDTASLTECIKYYNDNRDALNETKKHNYDLGQCSMNWETESEKFVKLVQSVLGEC